MEKPIGKLKLGSFKRLKISRSLVIITNRNKKQLILKVVWIKQVSYRPISPTIMDIKY